MVLERHQGCLLAGEEHRSSLAVADNEMQAGAPSFLYQNCLPLVVIDCRHQQPLASLLSRTETTQSPIPFRISEPHVVAQGMIL